MVRATRGRTLDAQLLRPAVTWAHCKKMAPAVEFTTKAVGLKL